MKKSVLVFALALANASAQASSYHAPLAWPLLEARRVYVKIASQGANQDVLNDTFTYFHKWERFAIVQSPSEACKVVEIEIGRTTRYGTEPILGKRAGALL